MNAGDATVSFPEDQIPLEEHVRTCGSPYHYGFALGIYDQHGQRLNAYRSFYCGTDRADYVEAAAAQSAFWPGSQICVWADASVEPPKNLRTGPAPDATAG